MQLFPQIKCNIILLAKAVYVNKMKAPRIEHVKLPK